MGRRGFLAKRLRTVGLAALVVGGILVGTAVAATATRSAEPSITVTPNTGLSVDPTAPSPVQLTGKGFDRGQPSVGGFSECSTAAGQPTVAVSGLGAVPVSCSDPFSAESNVKRDGKIPLVGAAMVVGTVGPPAVGTDTSGDSAAADAVNFPCPPYASQVAAGATCEILYVDAAGQSASAPISFTAGSTPGTTTTTTMAAGSCPQPVGPATASAGPGDGSGTVTVDPATCLVGGENVTVTATGLTPFNSSRNPLGTLLECNNSSSQPTEDLDGSAIPVSCSGALANTFTPNAAGSLNATFTVVEGTTGPPVADATDSAGNPGADDAALYPCPPTPAQVADGVVCVLAVGDSAGDQIVVPLAFNTPAPPPTCSGPVEPATVSAGAGDGSGTVTVDPATCLVGGQTVTVTATGLTPYSTTSNFFGALVECNTSPGQPTLDLAGNEVPVSCTGFLADSFTPNAPGTLTRNFPIVAGTTGPPFPGIDSAGDNAATDAAQYPCPPTAAQVSAGAACVLELEDYGGDKIAVPLSFDTDEASTNRSSSSTKAAAVHVTG
jgi:hypothetical protein